MTQREIRRLRAAVAGLRSAVRNLEDDARDLRRQLEAAVAAAEGREGPPSPVEDLMQVESQAPPGVLRGLVRRIRHLLLYWLAVAGKAWRGELKADREHAAVPFDPFEGLLDAGAEADDAIDPEVEGWLRILARPAEGGSDPESRPTVLVLLDAAPTGGVEQVLGSALAGLAADLRFVLVALGPADELGARRLAGLARLTPHVYPLSAVHQPEMWPSLVEGLVDSYAAGCVLNIGDGGWLARNGERLRDGRPGLRVVDLPLRGTGPRPGADLSPAGAGSAEQALQGLGLTPVVRLPAPAPVLPTADERRQQVRRELGVRGDEVAVLACGDLVPDRRPEDMVELARRLDPEDRFRVVLVGRGPLDTTVVELARLAGVRCFALSRPRQCEADLLAAADIVCSPAEFEPFPAALLGAAAAGKPVVAYRIGDLEGLLPEEGGAASLAEVADVAALEAAVRAAGPVSARGPRETVADGSERLTVLRAALLGTAAERG